MTNAVHPFEYLEALEQSASLYSSRIPDAQTDTVNWNGVCFMLGSQHLMVQVGDISEILPVPQTTPLPGVQRWAKGIANVRGRLIPIVDLGEFLGNNRKTQGNASRILVVGRKDLSVGLVVDEVQGMMQFSNNSFSEELPAALPDSLHPYTQGCYSQDAYLQDKKYVVFSIEQLISHERFLTAASE